MSDSRSVLHLGKTDSEYSGQPNSTPMKVQRNLTETDKLMFLSLSDINHQRQKKFKVVINPFCIRLKAPEKK